MEWGGQGMRWLKMVVLQMLCFFALQQTFTYTLSSFKTYDTKMKYTHAKNSSQILLEITNKKRHKNSICWCITFLSLLSWLCVCMCIWSTHFVFYMMYFLAPPSDTFRRKQINYTKDDGQIKSWLELMKIIYYDSIYSFRSYTQ